VQLNIDPVFVLHNVIVATAAFAFAHVFRRPWVAVIASFCVGLAASLGWRTLTPALSFIWDRCVWQVLVNGMRPNVFDGELVAAVVLFWLIPLSIASVLAVVFRRQERQDVCLSSKSWVILVVGVLVALVMLVWSVIASGK
jgi:hypothetical protein